MHVFMAHICTIVRAAQMNDVLHAYSAQASFAFYQSNAANVEWGVGVTWGCWSAIRWHVLLC